jgi:ATP-binding cassette subfamily B protein
MTTVKPQKVSSGDMSETTEQPPQNSGFGRVMEVAGTKKALLNAACAIGVLATALQFAPCVLTYFAVLEIIDATQSGSELNRGLIRQLALYSIGCLVGFAVIQCASLILSHIAAFSIIYELQMALAAKLSRLSLGYFATTTSGAIRTLMFSHTAQLEKFIAHHLVDITSALVIPLIAIIAMAVIDWRLMVPVVIPFPMAVMVYVSYMRSAETAERIVRYYREIADLNSAAVEFVNGMPVVKIFSRAGVAVGRFADQIRSHAKMVVNWSKSFCTSYAIYVTLIGGSVTLTTVVAVIIAVVDSDLKSFIQKFVFFALLGGGLHVPILKLTFFASVLAQTLEGMKEIDALLNAEELSEPDNPRNPADASLEFQNVTFSYAAEEVLHDVSFRAEAGQLIGLVGPSGGGKTTIAQLAARFWDIQQGHILVGGVDIREIATSKLMDSVAFVFQDIHMFRDTIEENIRMGNTTATMEDVQNAARAAQAEDFILRLPNGYQTKLSENSIHLSGGEMQRISIARAILKDAPIVILDEATAYADAENEARIQAAFAELTRGKTVLVTAHRLSAIQDADCILVIDQGRIVEQGRHEDLMAHVGLYHEIVGLYNRAQNWSLDVNEKPTSE